MPFRNREHVWIIKGFIKLNLSGSVGRKTSRRKKRVQTSSSWTLSIPGVGSYNTRDGKYRVNTPGPGWWESYSRSQRQQRKLEKKVARAASTTPAGTGTGRAKKVDQQAAHYARYFAAIDREGGDSTSAALAAGRCSTCGNLMRPGQWCVPCAQKAAKRHEQAEAREDARARHETKLYGTPPATAAPGTPAPARTRPPVGRPAPPPVDRSTFEEGSCTCCGGNHGAAKNVRRGRCCDWCPGHDKTQPKGDTLAQIQASLDEQRRREQPDGPQVAQGSVGRSGARPDRAAGPCGAKTQSGGRCRNTGDCPHHRGSVLA